MGEGVTLSFIEINRVNFSNEKDWHKAFWGCLFFEPGDTRKKTLLTLVVAFNQKVWISNIFETERALTSAVSSAGSQVTYNPLLPVNSFAVLK